MTNPKPHLREATGDPRIAQNVAAASVECVAQLPMSAIEVSLYAYISVLASELAHTQTRVGELERIARGRGWTVP